VSLAVRFGLAERAPAYWIAFVLRTPVFALGAARRAHAGIGIARGGVASVRLCHPWRPGRVASSGAERRIDGVTGVPAAANLTLTARVGRGAQSMDPGFMQRLPVAATPPSPCPRRIARRARLREAGTSSTPVRFA
jgi:hypothetical protein